ncbi:MAG: imidazole glycerol phosphate synthase subunit HisH [Clostridia bacterium]|nr:imidazole glycerol phosphate synthase subunit HisH [Clostridia bacterium]MBR5768028.1 imidazole glycerol phosphate synthase subunit HisH [Clostridia bacterium]
MIAVVDYGVGNLFSVVRSLRAIGEDAAVTGDREELDRADGIILPGVGAFGEAAEKLRATGLDEYLKKAAAGGRPLLGICLGMQLLFDEGLEFGSHRGLGLISGRVVPMRDRVPADVKIPHIGWNALEIRKKDSALMKYTSEGDCVYFVHSYYAADCDENTVAVADYHFPVTAVVARDNVFGCQFHPEKSGGVGLGILRAFCEMGGVR